ncbi:acyltransferase [Vibrio sp. EJY3]|uniref:acyltransferase family protein n=1 Tax=Vibrio sp. (strain EJY3) TaxID=1116375 RepID=UPI000243A5D0|nr:acyltransferase [Vibrio sp. EJY3]AEX20720.1 acyltransferase 3 [Vibrio sp. EJY3]
MVASSSTRGRLGYLDGLRGVAVLCVVLYHYFSRFESDNFYAFPPLNDFIFFRLVDFGYYGVHLFFTISGFVIALTLYNCNSIKEFVIRRFARLWPPMLLCSICTFVYLSIFDGVFETSIWRFIPTLTFIEPYFFNKLIHGIKFGWIDGAYWSLFVEVRFYFWAAVIYFFTKKFEQSFLIFCLIAYVLSLVLVDKRSQFIIHMMFFTEHLYWFVLGMGFYFYHVDKRKLARFYILSSALFFFMTKIGGFIMTDLIVLILVTNTFFVLNKFTFCQKIFSQNWLTSIGVCSYSLYLLHQNIGVDLNLKIAKSLNMEGYLSAVVPFLMLIIMIVISHLIYIFYEKPLNKKIVKFSSSIKKSSQVKC